MANNKKNGRRGDRKGDIRKDDDALPHRKGGLLPLMLIFIVLSAATLLFLSETAKFKAIELLSHAKSAVMAFYNDDESDDTTGGFKGSGAALKIQNNIAAKFNELGLGEDEYAIRLFPAKDSISVSASVPRGRPIEWIIWELTNVAKSTPFEVEDCFCAPSPQTNCAITFKNSNPKYSTKVSINIQFSNRVLPNAAKMAILIEDFGFEINQATAEILSFPEPLTIAIVPTANLIAAWPKKIADEHKKEIVLQLPLESHQKELDRYKQHIITIHMSEENIRATIAQAATAIPNFSGISNYQGGRAMEDSRIVGIILSEANKRKVYFTYSDVSKKSVAPQLAKEMKVPNYPIQGSIDANLSTDQIKDKLRRYVVTAEKTGRILIKTQPSLTFIQALKEETASMKKNGIGLVYVSDLTK